MFKLIFDSLFEVRGIVTRRFEEAVSDEDLASIERFFKIFPLINMHEEGLRKFTHYLRGKLSAASKENLKQALDTPPGDKVGGGHVDC